MRRNPVPIKLFNNGSLSSLFEKRSRRILEEINNYDKNALLNACDQDLYEYFEQKYQLVLPELKEEYISQSSEEVDVELRRDIRSYPVTAKGIAFTFYVSYEGDRTLFEYKPTTFGSSLPIASILDDVLAFTFERTDHNAEAVKRDFEEALSRTKQYLEWVKKDVLEFNSAIHRDLPSLIQTRKQKILDDQQMVKALGYPLRHRDDAPKTYAVPALRKKLVPQRQTTLSPPFVPEPTLSMQDYENILTIISNMAFVMEKSPKAFKNMGEEDLRTHFLVQLNGQYEGRATGETFNYNGKTDILIQEEGKNIFIAECKFWGGSEKLKETIDQLLGYTTWRDTKTAILIFNRNKDFSAVIGRIEKVVQAHPNYKRKVEDYVSDTGYRFILRHNNDENREIILTILAFEVPLPD